MNPTAEPSSQFGEYTLGRKLGAGGQGQVYEARDAIGLTWALKIGHRIHAHDEAALARFTREAQWVNATFGALPRNCGILVGEHYGVFDQHFYVKMRLVDGESLAQRLNREGPLEASTAIALAKQLALIVSIAHSNNAVHRDLKPENVLLEGENLQVVDWGCIQLVEAGHFAQSAAGPLCTLGYAPPEQYELRSGASPATDIYALGVIAFEMLTGYNPFLGTWRNGRARGRVAERATRTAKAGDVSSTLASTTGLYPTVGSPAGRSAPADAVTRITAPTGIIPIDECMASVGDGDNANVRWPICSEPAPRRSMQQVVASQAAFTWDSVRSVVDVIPLRLAELVEQMLQPKPEHRPSSMSEVAERLASIEQALSQPVLEVARATGATRHRLLAFGFLAVASFGAAVLANQPKHASTNEHPLTTTAEPNPPPVAVSVSEVPAITVADVTLPPPAQSAPSLVAQSQRSNPRESARKPSRNATPRRSTPPAPTPSTSTAPTLDPLYFGKR